MGQSLHREQAATIVTGAASEEGARLGLSRGQKQLLLILVLCACVMAVASPAPMALFMLLASALFLLEIIVLLGAAIESWSASALARVGKAADRNRQDWPLYSIMIPLYREAAVAEQLIDAMAALDYPTASLELLLLIESDDAETAAALRPILPAHGRILVVPDGQPRTKPRALNHGLSRASGDYITVFDAEDIPEPDQLKRAVRLFERAPRQVRCLQGGWPSTTSPMAGCR